MAKKPEPDGIKLVARNKRAWHNYEILEKMEAGLVLKGSEVKSIRNGKVSIQEAYARIKGNSAWVVGMDISLYPQAGPLNHDPLRPRKLLLHKRELRKLEAHSHQRGLTVVPLSLYFKGGRAKMEIGLARGRVKYDKRQVMRKKEAEKEIRRQKTRR